MIARVDELASQLRPLLFRLYYVIRRQTPQLTLTLTQGSVLTELVRSGPRRMSTLAELEGVRLPSMTDVAARLARLGLVRREPDPGDGRAVLVSPTKQGRRFHGELVAAREQFLRQRLVALTPDERAAIDAALPALRGLLHGTRTREKEELVER